MRATDLARMVGGGDTAEDDDGATAFKARGACRGMDPNIFFPHRGDEAGLAQARAVCATCDVTDECLAYGLTLPVSEAGVYSGRSGREMQALRQRQGRSSGFRFSVPHARRRSVATPFRRPDPPPTKERPVPEPTTETPPSPAPVACVDCGVEPIAAVEGVDGQTRCGRCHRRTLSEEA